LEVADIVGPWIVAVSGKDVDQKYRIGSAITPGKEIFVAFGPNPLQLLWELSRQRDNIPDERSRMLFLES